MITSDEAFIGRLTALEARRFCVDEIESKKLTSTANHQFTRKQALSRLAQSSSIRFTSLLRGKRKRVRGRSRSYPPNYSRGSMPRDCTSSASAKWRLITLRDATGGGAVLDLGVQVPRSVGVLQRAHLLAWPGCIGALRGRKSVAPQIRYRGRGQTEIRRQITALVPSRQLAVHDQESGLLSAG